jgi:hypothetical protein
MGSLAETPMVNERNQSEIGENILVDLIKGTSGLVKILYLVFILYTIICSARRVSLGTVGRERHNSMEGVRRANRDKGGDIILKRKQPPLFHSFLSLALKGLCYRYQ